MKYTTICSKKVKRILAYVQQVITSKKQNIHNLYNKKKLTDYERGVICGMHTAYNDIQRELHSLIKCADNYIDSINCREENEIE